MFYYALVFFVIALIGALLGMRGVAGMSAEIGYFLAIIGVIFAVVALVTRRAPRIGP